MQPAVRHECIDHITEEGILLPMQCIFNCSFSCVNRMSTFYSRLEFLLYRVLIEWIIYLEALNYLSVVDMFDPNGPIVGLLVQALTLSHLHTYLRDVLFSCWLTRNCDACSVRHVCVCQWITMHPFSQQTAPPPSSPSEGKHKYCCLLLKQP